LNHTAECCPIYGDVDKYIQYSKTQTYKFQQSKLQKSPQKPQLSDPELPPFFGETTIENSLKSLLDDISRFNFKYGISSYFSGSGGKKEGPITRELDKYGRGIQRIANDDMEGLLPTKKIKFDVEGQKKEGMLDVGSEEDDVQSAMPSQSTT
jgi:hypothetical protein